MKSEKKIEGDVLEGHVHSECAQLPKKMDEVELSMFSRAYYTFLSSPVKINNPTSLSR